MLEVDQNTLLTGSFDGLIRVMQVQVRALHMRAVWRWRWRWRSLRRGATPLPGCEGLLCELRCVLLCELRDRGLCVVLVLLLTTAERLRFHGDSHPSRPSCTA